MLKVTIELVSAITRKTSTIGVAFLSNDGTGTRDRGNYDVQIMRKGVESPLGKTTREGRVENYPRVAYNVWRLIARGLHAAFPEERDPGVAKLNANVMTGLRKLAEYPSTDGDIINAKQWILAGNIEPDAVYATDALGCKMTDADAREEFQRSIFRGLKMIGEAVVPESTEDLTEEQRLDVQNALQFVNALPV